MIKRHIQLSIRFERDIKYLKKRYPQLQADLKPIIQQLEAGETLGSRVPHLDAVVYKVRIPSRDQQRGKSGGFRLLYYI